MTCRLLVAFLFLFHPSLISYAHDGADSRQRIQAIFDVNPLAIDPQNGSCGTDVHNFIMHLRAQDFDVDRLRIYEVDQYNQRFRLRDSVVDQGAMLHFFLTYEDNGTEYVFDYLTNTANVALDTWLVTQLGGLFVTDTTYRFARWSFKEYDNHFKQQAAHHEQLTFSQLAPTYFARSWCQVL